MKLLRTPEEVQIDPAKAERCTWRSKQSRARESEETRLSRKDQIIHRNDVPDELFALKVERSVENSAIRWNPKYAARYARQWDDPVICDLDIGNCCRSQPNHRNTNPQAHQCWATNSCGYDVQTSSIRK